MARTYLEALDEMRQQDQNPTPFLSSQSQTAVPQPSPPQKKQFRTYLEALADLPAPSPKAPVKPLTEPEPLGQRILNALPLDAIQKYAIDPLDKVAQFGAEAGKGFAEPLPYSASVAARSGQIVPSEPVSPAEQGVREAAGELVGSTLADPRNLPFLLSGGAANPIAKRAIAAGFAALMGKGSVEAAGQYGASMDQPVPESEKARLATHAIVSPFLAGMAGAGIGERKPAEAAPVEAAPVEAAPAIPAGGVRMVNAELKRAAPSVQPAAPQTAQPAITPEEAVALEQAQARPEVPNKPKLQEGMAVPAQISPQQVAQIEQAGFKIGEDGKLHRAETPRVGEEHPQIEAQVPEKPVASAPPAQPEVHPNYEQIGIDADTRQPILKAKVGETPQSPQEAPSGEVQAKPQPIVQGQQGGGKATQGEVLQPSTVSREAKVSQWIDKLFEQRARSEAVQGRVEDLSDNETDQRPIMREFWEQTFPSLPEKGQKQFLGQLKAQMGMQPGDTLIVKKDGGSVVAKNWRDITDTFFGSDHVGDLEQNEQAIVGLADILNEMRRKSGNNAPFSLQEAPKALESQPSQGMKESANTAPPQFTSDNQPGANYSADELKAFKEKHGIAEVKPQMVGAEQGKVPPPGQVGTMRVSDISVDPHRFQFKLGTDAEGVGALLKESPKFNPELAGTVSVWTDPADGKTYVINGHHRLELAKRTGQQEIAVRHIKAYDAADARARGALQNIAEGRGSSLDAAKFFRESGMTPETIRSEGVSLGEATAKRGLALSNLDEPIFNRVVQGEIPEGRAVAIGEATKVPSEQKAILDLLQSKETKGRQISDETLRELIRFVKGTGQTTETSMNLFGSQEITRSYALEKAEISAFIKKQLANDRKLFGYVAQGERAAKLKQERVGNIKTRKAGQISESAAQAEEVYNRLSERAGPVADVLERSARQLAEGGKSDAVKQQAYDAIRQEISAALAGENPRNAARPEAAAGPGNAALQERGVSEPRAQASVGPPKPPGMRRPVESATSLLDFISEAGKNLKVEPYHEQGNIFGGTEKQFVLKDGNSYRIVTEARLKELFDNAPAGWHPQSPALDPFRSAAQVSRQAENLTLAGEPVPQEQPRLFGAGDLGEIIGPTNLTPIERGKYKAAKQRFEDKLFSSHAGVDPTAVADLLEIGYYHFKSGARTLAAWSKAMIQELGEEFRPYAKSVWDELQRKLADGETLTAKAPSKKAETGVPFLSNEPEPKTSSAAPPFLSTPKKVATGLPEPEKFAGNINLEKLSGPEQVIRVIKQTAKDFAPELEKSRRGVIPNQETKASAKKLVEDGLFTEKDLANIKKGSTLNAEQMNAARGILLDISGDVAKAAKDYEKNDSSENLLKLEALKYRQIAIQRSVSGATAEAGRALQSFKIIAKALREKNVSNYQKVIDALGEKRITEEVARKLAQIPEDDLVALNKFLRAQKEFTTADKLAAYWTTNILSGPPTHARNFFSNAIFGALQVPARLAAGLVDAPLAKVLGRERQVYASEAIPATIGYFAGIPEGMKRAAYIIRNGFDIADAQKLEQPRVYEFKGGAKNPWNQVGRLLVASDAMFKSMALHSELRAISTRQSIKEGLSGKLLVDRAEELASNPTPEMMDKAVEYSKWATFNSRPGPLNQKLIAIREWEPLAKVNIHVRPLKFVIPFISTPGNIVRTGLVDYSPLGLAKLGNKEVRAGAESSEVVAKALIGTGILTTAAVLAANGKLTGTAPSDPAQRDAFERAGKQAYSIKIGDRWVQYDQMAGPLAITLAAAAAFHDAFAQKGDIPTTTRIAQAGATIGNSVVNASFFKGVEDLLQAISDPARFGEQFASSVSQGFVPMAGFLRTTANAVDEKVRDAQGVYERIMAGLPLVSENLPAKLDTRGRERTKRGGEGALAYLPSRVPEDKPIDAVDAELTRLGVTLGSPGATVTIRNQRYQLDRNQQRELQRAEGANISTRLEKLFASDSYQGMTDERKQRAASYVIREARDAARMQYVRGLRESNVPLTPKAKVQPYFLGAQPE